MRKIRQTREIQINSEGGGETLFHYLHLREIDSIFCFTACRGVFCLANDLKEFFNDFMLDNLLLIKAVCNDLQIPQYLQVAARKALGHIDRFVTKPLWKLLVKMYITK